MKSEKADTFIFREKNTTVRVYCDDIVFFESNGHYITLHMADGAIYNTRCTMRELIEVLDKKRYVRVHRGIVVNLCYIKSINYNYASLNSMWGGVPISRSYRGRLKAALNVFYAK